MLSKICLIRAGFRNGIEQKHKSFHTNQTNSLLAGFKRKGLKSLSLTLRKGFKSQKFSELKGLKGLKGLKVNRASHTFKRLGAS